MNTQKQRWNRCDFWDCRCWFDSVPYVHWHLGYMSVHCSRECMFRADKLREEAGIRRVA